jgi:hypothetical protein
MSVCVCGGEASTGSITKAVEGAETRPSARDAAGLYKREGVAGLVVGDYCARYTRAMR